MSLLSAMQVKRQQLRIGLPQKPQANRVNKVEPQTNQADEIWKSKEKCSLRGVSYLFK